MPFFSSNPYWPRGASDSLASFCRGVTSIVCLINVNPVLVDPINNQRNSFKFLFLVQRGNKQVGFIRKNVDDFLEKNSLEPDFVRVKH